MAAVSGVWAIDIGTTSLKALRLRPAEEGFEVVGFSHIEHARPLTAGGVGPAEKSQMISDTLRNFLEENDVGKEEVGISIAGQNSFSRFIKLPPVEPKKIPEIVQFEAVQQIPFDINEVEWDWQLMENEASPDKEVGLFAIKNELISEVMDHFTRAHLRVTCVQIAPMALYNFAYYDRAEVVNSPNQAVVILDMGADSSTLVICTKHSVWQRSIRIGGNTFTQAIADAFKKDFAVAEKLKRTAPMSKYMRQIYTAMKPVYTDFGSELQRSLGFYSSSPQGRDKTFTKMIAMGGGMKLQGLAKYLTQTLGLTVVKPDSFERLHLSAEVSSAKFHENVSDFGVVYGLGVQLLNEAKIRTNLLPRRIARAMNWTRKSRFFTAAACIFLVVSILALAMAFKASRQYQAQASARAQIQGAVTMINTVKSQISEQEDRQQPLIDQVDKEQKRFQYRDVLPRFNALLLKCLPNKENNPSQAELYAAFESGNSQAMAAVPRPQRKQLFVTRIAVEYTKDLEVTGLPQANKATGPKGTRGTPGMMRPEMMMMPEMMMPGMGMQGGGAALSPTARQPGAAPGQGEAKAGFTVLIEGYSPYQNIGELLDPPMVGSDQSRWGVITRFENLEKLFPQMPFSLYNKKEIEHFKVEWGLVDLIEEKNMPMGIGIQKEIERVPPPEGTDGRGVRMTMNTAGQSNYVYTETVLVDPMTGEEISRTYDIVTQKDIDDNPQQYTEKDLGRKKTQYGKEQFIERDHWFRIQAKFIWKDAPAGPATTPYGGFGPAM